MNLSQFLPDEDYRFTMRFERGSPEKFFAPTGHNARLLAERRRWLDESPSHYAALLNGGEALLGEFVELLRSWPATRDGTGELPDAPAAACVELGRRLEPDFLLLQADAAGALRLLAGCVCFPSSWSLGEKMGCALEEIHGPVPGLNAQLGRPAAGFLSKMAPGISWLRANWGLSRSAELNQHPNRNLPRLDTAVTPDEVWFRVERQALIALPRTAGVLFGIRVEVHSLAELMAETTARQGLRRALETMPEAMAAYKGLAAARAGLIQVLQ